MKIQSAKIAERIPAKVQSNIWYNLLGSKHRIFVVNISFTSWSSVFLFTILVHHLPSDGVHNL